MPKIAFRVGRGAFIPPPNVTSAVVHLEVHEPAPLPQHEFAAFFALVRAGFGNRRKMLRNSLATGTGLTPGAASRMLAQADLQDSVRAQELDVEDWLRLYATSRSVRDD
jgi:16S rRNA (adenine1518-N6/adenine1519-N6)-dimethyltransferase